MSGNTTKQVQPTRDEIRAAIFNQKAAVEPVVFFGQKLELRQPELGTILDMRQEGLEMNGMKMLTDFAFVPGTNEKVFEEADTESLRQLPFGPDVQRLMSAVAVLLGVSAEGLDSLVKDALKRDTPGGSDASPDDESGSGAASVGGGDSEVAAESAA